MIWTEEERSRRPRAMPDQVRTAACRALVAWALTLCGTMVAVLAWFAGTWFVASVVLGTAGLALAATWCTLDIWVARQVAAQECLRNTVPVWGSPATTPKSGQQGWLPPPPFSGPLGATVPCLSSRRIQDERAEEVCLPDSANRATIGEHRSSVPHRPGDPGNAQS